MAKIENIEIPGFNPKATSYKDCIKNTQAIEKVRSKLVWNRTFWQGQTNMLREQRNPQFNQAEDNFLNTQKKINKLTVHLRNWGKKAAQTPEGQKKEQKKFANEQKLASQEKTKNRIRKKIKAAFFPPICPKR